MGEWASLVLGAGALLIALYQLVRGTENRWESASSRLTKLETSKEQLEKDIARLDARIDRITPRQPRS